MAFLGLVPSENSSGPKKRKGAITKTGNTHVRKVITEAAQTYRHPARISRHLLKRQEGLANEICDIAWKCFIANTLIKKRG
jgi:transposase